MGSTNKRSFSIFSFITGILCTIALLFLTGTASYEPVGKYRMEVTTTHNNINNIYVIDTTTGRVKWLNKLNLSFDEIKED